MIFNVEKTLFHIDLKKFDFYRYLLGIIGVYLVFFK